MGAGTRAMDRLGRGVSLSETQGPEDTSGCAAPWSPSGCRRRQSCPVQSSSLHAQRAVPSEDDSAPGFCGREKGARCPGGQQVRPSRHPWGVASSFPPLWALWAPAHLLLVCGIPPPLRRGWPRLRRRFSLLGRGPCSRSPGVCTGERGQGEGGSPPAMASGSESAPWGHLAWASPWSEVLNPLQVFSAQTQDTPRQG